MNLEEPTRMLRLERLFTADLTYRDGLGPVIDPSTREGDHIGNGDGVLEGDRLSGTLTWSMFAGDCAYLLVKDGIDPGPGRHLCTTSLVGEVRTADNATVWMETRGFGLRGFDAGRPHIWRISMATRFETDASEHQWLNDALAVIDGTFDEELGQARYEAYLSQ